MLDKILQIASKEPRRVMNMRTQKFRFPLSLTLGLPGFQLEFVQKKLEAQGGHE